MSECNVMCDYFGGTPKLASTSTCATHTSWTGNGEPLLFLSAVNSLHLLHHDLGSGERCTFYLSSLSPLQLRALAHTHTITTQSACTHTHKQIHRHTHTLARAYMKNKKTKQHQPGYLIPKHVLKVPYIYYVYTCTLEWVGLVPLRAAPFSFEMDVVLYTDVTTLLISCLPSLEYVPVSTFFITQHTKNC